MAIYIYKEEKKKIRPAMDMNVGSKILDQTQGFNKEVSKDNMFTTFGGRKRKVYK